MPDVDTDSCDVCGESPAPNWEEIEHEDTGELTQADLCDDCHADLVAYNRGEITAAELVDDRKGADISDDGTYRYRLWRTWDPSKDRVGFIMLNPSTADESEDDPTIRRCIGFAKDWGYGGIVVGNLFALRSPKPSVLTDHDNPVGPRNGEALAEIIDDVDLVVAAWGTDGAIQGRGKTVRERFDTEFMALDVTKHGHPAHPLYQPADAELEVLDDE